MGCSFEYRAISQAGDRSHTRQAAIAFKLSNVNASSSTALTLTWKIRNAPMAAPRNMAPVADKRRAIRGLFPPAHVESAASPVRVNVSTVVVRSGTARNRRAAFVRPIARESSTLDPHCDVL